MRFRAPVLTGADGSRYGVVACQIQKTGSTWEVFSDSTHTGIGTQEVDVDSEKITLNLAFQAEKILALVAMPSKEFAAKGISFGALPFRGKVDIFPYRANRTISGEVHYVPEVPEVPADGETPAVPAVPAYWAISEDADGIVSAEWDTDGVVITHDECVGYFATVEATSGSDYTVKDAAHTTTTQKVSFYDLVEEVETKVTTEDDEMQVTFCRITGKVTELAPADIPCDGYIQCYGIYEL